MILIADSGSTKSDWALVNNGERTFTETMGLNPFFHNSEFISKKLLDNPVLTEHKEAVTSIFYYGAGCSSEEKISIVDNALRIVFPNANSVAVRHDIDAAAYATCGNSPGIVCILGTGSNSCVYDGQNVVANFPALGYILGDEGSGSYFGKRLLSNYFYGTLPKEIERSIDDIGMSKDKLMNTVYNQPHANVFLASLMKSISQHNNHPYISDMVHEGFSSFAEIHIKCFENYRDYEVHFIGSLAHFYREILEGVSEKVGFKLGSILRQPIQKLVDYHKLASN
jgi:glucosamine kinase